MWRIHNDLLQLRTGFYTDVGPNHTFYTDVGPNHTFYTDADPNHTFYTDADLYPNFI